MPPAALHPVVVVIVVVAVLEAAAASAALGFVFVAAAAAVADAVAAAVPADAAVIVVAVVAHLVVAAVAGGVAVEVVVDPVLVAVCGVLVVAVVALAAAAAAVEVARHHCEPHPSPGAIRWHSRTGGRNHERGSPRHTKTIPVGFYRQNTRCFYFFFSPQLQLRRLLVRSRRENPCSAQTPRTESAGQKDAQVPSTPEGQRNVSGTKQAVTRCFHFL